MKTREQILDECAAPYSCQHVGRYRDSALEAMSQFKNQEVKEWQEECERLVKVAEFWQKEYYKLNPRIQTPKLDNL